MPAAKVRYAVVGLGYIAQIAVLPAFRNARKNSELTALVSGDPEKLARLGEQYGVRRRFGYDDFDRALREVDAVYIALPNHMHHPFTVAACQAGVHVLCEKPLAVTSEQCRDMVAVAKANGVRLMTAYRLHYERGNLQALEVVRSGEIGEPRIFVSAFSMQVEEGNIRLGSKEMGGGPTYDLGIYCINAARHFFDSEPRTVKASSGNSGADKFEASNEMVMASMTFPGSRLASFVVSNGGGKRSWYEIVGTKGYVRMSPAYDYANPLLLEVEGRSGRKRSRFPRRDQFAPELLEFSECIRTNREPVSSGSEGLADVRVVEAIHASVDLRAPVDMPDFSGGAALGIEQAIYRAPVAKPELVNARPPSGD